MDETKVPEYNTDLNNYYGSLPTPDMPRLITKLIIENVKGIKESDVSKVGLIDPEIWITQAPDGEFYIDLTTLAYPKAPKAAKSWLVQRFVDAVAYDAENYLFRHVIAKLEAKDPTTAIHKLNYYTKLPDLATDCQKFAHELQSHSENDIVRFITMSRAASDAEKRLSDLINIKEMVKIARAAKMTDEYEYYYIPDVFSDHDGEFINKDSLNDWPFHRHLFNQINPELLDSRSIYNRHKYKEALDVISLVKKPPFVFGTERVDWTGIDLKALTDDLISGAFEVGFDVMDYLDNELSEHYDEAIENVVDIEALDNAISYWMRDSHVQSNWKRIKEGYDRDENIEHTWPTDLEADERLRVFLDAWNRKQNITTYKADMNIIIMRKPDATIDDAVQYLNQDIERTEKWLSQFKSTVDVSNLDNHVSI